MQLFYLKITASTSNFDGTPTCSRQSAAQSVGVYTPTEIKFAILHFCTPNSLVSKSMGILNWFSVNIPSQHLKNNKRGVIYEDYLAEL